MHILIKMEVSNYLMESLEISSRKSEFRKTVNIYKSETIRNLKFISRGQENDLIFIAKYNSIIDQTRTKDEWIMKVHKDVEASLLKVIGVYLRKISSHMLYDIKDQINKLNFTFMNQSSYKNYLKAEYFEINKVLESSFSIEESFYIRRQWNYLKLINEGNIDIVLIKLASAFYDENEESKSLIKITKEMIDSNYFVKLRVHEIKPDTVSRDFAELRNTSRRRIVIIDNYQDIKNNLSINTKRAIQILEKRHTFIIGGLKRSDGINLTFTEKIDLNKENQSNEKSYKSRTHIKTIIDNILEDIDKMIGLDNAKKVVKEIIINSYVEKNIWKQKTINSNHFMFMGNPGTGKTTLARYLSEGLYRANVLEKNLFIEVDRSGLVGEHVGKTAIKTMEKLQKANGGVLFIDEAYSLYNGSEIDYGKEALNTITKYMEDNRNGMSIIFAGYEEAMEDLFSMNKGLKSRINHHIHFSDYNAQELVELYKIFADNEGFEAEEILLEALYEDMEKYLSIKDIYFANGRFIRNIYEKSKTRCANRIFQEEDICERILRVEDYQSIVFEAKAIESVRMGF